MTDKLVILGAGIAGISAAHHLKLAGYNNSIVFEKNGTWGGLCDNFEIEGFRFDKFIHLSFTNDPYVKKLFSNSSEIFKFKPEPLNYYNKYWLKHPAQNNIFPLRIKEKINIITGFINRKHKNINEINNYEEWLRVSYGDYFAEKFPMIYTKKYWTVEAKELETKWIGNRMYVPQIEEILEGAMTSETPSTYYAKEMRYPLRGGYKSFLSSMTSNIEIKLEHEITKIDLEKKEIEVNSTDIVKFDKIISSLPLPEIINLLTGVPSYVIEASKKLTWTSGALISLGFSKPDIANKLWFYIYDNDIKASRIYSPSLKSKDNIPYQCSSIQAEIYFSVDNPLIKDLKSLLNDEINKYIDIGLFNEEDILVKDIRIEKYANIIFNHDVYENRAIVKDYIENIGIVSIGRFGEWEYLWSDQSLLSGKNCVTKLTTKI